VSVDEQIDTAIAFCIAECMRDVDMQISAEPDPAMRALLRKARARIEAMVHERCTVGLREAWERHTAVLH
jgi:hypothetical protein